MTKKVNLTPVKGPDGRIYFNLSEIAACIDADIPVKGIKMAERRYWANVLRAMEAEAIQRIPSN